MILNTRRDRSSRLARGRLGFFAGTTASLAMLAFMVGPRLVLAQSQPAVPVAATNNQPLTNNPPANLRPTGPGPASGSRYKEPVGGEDPTRATPPQSALPAPTLVPPPPVAPAAPAAMNGALAPLPPVDPFGATPPAAALPAPPKRRATVEERLDRIERILAQLEAREGINANRRGVTGGLAGQPEEPTKEPSAAKSKGPQFGYWYQSRNYDDQKNRAAAQASQASRAAEQVQRAVEQAQEAVQRAQEWAEERQRAAEEAANELKEQDWKPGGLVTELDALRGARQSLQKELERLNQQIHRLEQDLHRLNQQSPDVAREGQNKPPTPAAEPGEATKQ